MKTILILTSSVLCLTLLAACEQAEQPAETTAPMSTSTSAEANQMTEDTAGTAQVATDNVLTKVQHALDKAMEVNKAKIEGALNGTAEAVETANE